MKSMRTALRALLQQLPISTNAYEAAEHRAITSEPQPSLAYVWPDVATGGTSPDLGGPILLISAPGAMGKSEAAKSIAHSLHTLYIDLAKVNVGSGTLLGELVKALGPVQMEQFRDDVRNGRATLVLDSTDEAQLRSGSDNYFEFLKDLEWFIDESTHGPRIILLGRSDSIALTEIALKLIDRPSPAFELQPLGYEQACDFVSAALDQSDYRLHREQPEPFSRLRDALLANLARSLVSQDVSCQHLSERWLETESFLGYPPVLLALGERLKVSNPQAEFSRLNADGSAHARRQRGELLREVVEYILDRETGKVRSALGESLGIRPGDADSRALYSRDEQAERLLNLTGTREVALARPAVLSEDERARYEDLIAGFVQDHPFVRGSEFANPVFSDYLRAWAVSSPVSELLAVERAPFLASLPPVGPFFARFLAALSPSGATPSIPEDLVDDAIKSHAIGSSGARAWYQHRDGADAKLRILDDDPRLSEDDIEFNVTEASGVLTLTSPLSHVAVFTDYGLILRSGRGDQFDAGPDVVLVADEIEIVATVMRAISSERSVGTSVLVSRSAARHDRELRVVTYAPRDLVVSWPDHWHQWDPYVVSLGANVGRPISRNLATQVVVAVRKLLLAFHRTSREAPAVSADKVDRVVVGGSEVALSVRDALIELDVIERTGNQYQLGLPRLGELGVSWQNVHADDPFESLSDFCQKVINTDVFVSRHLSS